jgi:hypothetical protein
VRWTTHILWAFSNEEIYRELVHKRGWSPARYEGWAAGTLKQQLLAEKDVRVMDARREEAL